jgi:hypothetical protein
MDFYQKYLKYKRKYQELKMLGGALTGSGAYTQNYGKPSGSDPYADLHDNKNEAITAPEYYRIKRKEKQCNVLISHKIGNKKQITHKEYENLVNYSNLVRIPKETLDFCIRSERIKVDPPINQAVRPVAPPPVPARPVAPPPVPAHPVAPPPVPARPVAPPKNKGKSKCETMYPEIYNILLNSSIYQNLNSNLKYTNEQLKKLDMDIDNTSFKGKPLFEIDTSFWGNPLFKGVPILKIIDSCRSDKNIYDARENDNITKIRKILVEMWYIIKITQKNTIA